MPDNSTIKNVLLYDNAAASQSQLSMVAADSGRMFGSDDHKYFVMQLYNGQQLSEPKPITKAGKRNYPMMRSTFESWTKVFDLDQFELDRTDENLFKSHHTMLSNRQLLVAIDSIDLEIVEKAGRMAESNNRHFYFLNKIAQEKNKEKQKQETEEKKASMDSTYAATKDTAVGPIGKPETLKKTVPLRKNQPQSSYRNYQEPCNPRSPKRQWLQRNQPETTRNPTPK
ncbi:MAG: hypothetical protein IPM82_04020 [Saprospiraceae bacterium]|nr:hypothetical protein [Saprospiraceae bacterium]